MVIEKSRDLNLKEFLHLLQYEYVSARIRSQIYQKENDIKYWNKVSIGKKEKVINVSDRLKTEINIFTNHIELQKYIDLCMPKFGIISLSYKDNKEWEDLIDKEKQLYYKLGIAIISNSPNSLYEYSGIIEDINYKREVLTLKEDGNNLLHTFGFNEVRRIFDNNIWII